MSNEVWDLKRLLNGDFVPISDLDKDNKSKSAATKTTKINQVLQLKNYLYGEE